MVKTVNRVAPNGQVESPLETLARLDLVKLQEQRAELERQRDEAVAQFQNQIDALVVLEKAAYIRDHGKPPRKQQGPRKKKEAAAQPSPSVEGNKERIVKYLMVSQPAKTAVIAADLGLSPGSISGTISAHHELFEQAPNGAGWRLKRAARED